MTVMTGSYNWTTGAHFNNLENVVIIENDTKLCETFKTEYNKIITDYCITKQVLTICFKDSPKKEKKQFFTYTTRINSIFTNK